MDGRKRKSKPVAQAVEEDLHENEFKFLVDAVNEELQFRIKNNKDKIEAYFHVRCHRWLQDAESTCNRVEAGYRIMLKELQKS